jgi:hypothetical protein
MACHAAARPAPEAPIVRARRAVVDGQPFPGERHPTDDARTHAADPDLHSNLTSPMTRSGLALLAAGLLGCALIATPAHAQSPADSSAVRAAALDYIEGWYEGDSERMARALHPDLVKRIVRAGPQGDRLGEMTAAQLTGSTGRNGGVRGAPGRRDVHVLDVFGGNASVRIDAEEWIDYLHLVRWNGEWRIVNVLWAMR